jgi:putative membrane protein
MLFSYRKYRHQLSIALLIIFYGVGLVGILGAQDPISFARLSWLNLIISGGVLFVNHEEWSPKISLAVLFAGALGFVFEVIGVKTGAIFGAYSYGESLGWKLFDVPLVIGLNWAMLTYFSVYTFSKWINSWLIVAMLSAACLVGLDWIIEPVAVKLDFWTWEAAEIPLQNYVAWFVIAAIITKALAYTKEDAENKIAPYLFLMQLIFFTVLRIAL